MQLCFIAHPSRNTILHFCLHKKLVFEKMQLPTQNVSFFFYNPFAEKITAFKQFLLRAFQINILENPDKLSDAYYLLYNMPQAYFALFDETRTYTLDDGFLYDDDLTELLHPFEFRKSLGRISKSLFSHQATDSIIDSLIQCVGLKDIYAVSMDGNLPVLPSLQYNRIITSSEVFYKTLEKTSEDTLFVFSSIDNNTDLWNACLKMHRQCLDYSAFITASIGITTQYNLHKYLEEIAINLAHFDHVYLWGSKNNTIERDLLSLLDSYSKITVLTDEDIYYDDGKFYIKGISKKNNEVVVVCRLINGTGKLCAPFYCENGEIYSCDIISDSLSPHMVNRDHVDILTSILPTLRENGVKTLLIMPPSADKNITYNENIHKQEIRNGLMRLDLSTASEYNLKTKNLKRFINGYPTGFINEFKQIVKIHTDGYWHYADRCGDSINVLNDRRTIGHKRENRHNIFLFGPCLIASMFSPDGQTVASYLQSFLSDLNYDYNVINCGCEWRDVNANIRARDYCTDDIVIIMGDQLFSEFAERNDESLLSLKDAYSGDMWRYIWDSSMHVNASGNKRIAKVISDELVEKKYLLESQSPLQLVDFNLGISQSIKRKIWGKSEDFIEYKDAVLQQLGINLEERDSVGCIVMNCNPFTLGHLYLIEQASSQVDLLLVFVVQEDKSFFRFEDRMKMVKEGTKHIKNVAVFPSGSFMISSLTMPAYFLKSELQSEAIDETNDLRFFAEAIAPAFHISVRFVGTEPQDNLTFDYNYQMREVLEKYGIKVIEIDRLEYEDGYPVSASIVRKCMKDNDMETLKKLVPQSTYQYLVSNYAIG